MSNKRMHPLFLVEILFIVELLLVEKQVTVVILCVSFNIDGFRWAQTMAFAIAEINSNPRLLPNVTLGYSLYDNCVTVRVAFRAALTLISGREERFQLPESCAGSPPVLGIVGDPSSALYYNIIMY